VKYISDNRKARHDYFIHETYEAGIALTGTEVKSLRQGKVNLKDSFCRIENGEVFLLGMHISPYDQGNRFNHDPLRTRKLLLHKYEIIKLLGKIQEKGYTLIPLNLYFKKGKVKVTVALVTGKKLYDKRQALAEKEAKRDIERRMKKPEQEESQSNFHIYMTHGLPLRIKLAIGFIVFCVLAIIISALGFLILALPYLLGGAVIVLVYQIVKSLLRRH
jgi:SsrA-binding protein